MIRDLFEEHVRDVRLAPGATASRGDTRFRHRLRLETYSHYPFHAEAIRFKRGRVV
jgi:hypothetical protein